EGQVRLVAHQRHRAAPRRVEELMLQEALDAELAAVHIGAGMAAAGDDLAVFVEADLDRTTGRAIVAGRVLPLLHVLDGNGDRFAVLAAEEHRRFRAGQAACAAGSRASWFSSSMSRCTTPLSTLTLKRCVQPASGALAQPSARPIVQLCSGQATLSPNTMPWLS